MDRTRCPNCNAPVQNTLLIACPTCHIVFTEYEKSQFELLNQHKEALANEAATRALRRLFAWITLGFAILGAVAGIGLYQIYTNLRTMVSDRIAVQFDEPHIRQTLSEVAKTRASEILEEQVRPAIETVQQSTEKALRSIDGSLGEIRGRVDSVLKEFQSINEFTMATVEAQNDSRPAFDLLIKIANTKDNRFARNALQVLVQLSTDPQVTGLLTYPIDWSAEGINPDEASLEEFRAVYERQRAVIKSTILETIWKQKHFAKGEKLQFLYDTIKNTQSLRTLYKACELMNEEAKVNKNILAYDLYIEWWEKNKAQYREK